MTYTLEVKNLHKSFPGVHALKGIQFQLKPAEVHALVGENGAGKSTMMKCLFGIHEPSSGEIFIDGVKVAFKNSREALDNGIAMIHQELNPIPYRSIAENIWLGRYPTKGLPGMVDHKKMNDDTQKLFNSLGIQLSPTDLVATLSVSQIQMMEIAKAISYKAKIIFMDEPTSSLTENEVEHLFKMIRTLREQNVSVVYVSHKMNEIKTICNSVTVLRDGEYVGNWDINELTIEDIIGKMVGRQLSNLFPPKNYTAGTEEILEVRNFTSRMPNSFVDVSFKVKKGEILGIGGLVGAQRTELIESIFGIRPAHGEIFIHGTKRKIANPIDAKNNGLALLTEERRTTGILGCLNLEANTMICSYQKYSVKNFMVNDKLNHDITANYIKKLKVRTPNTKALIQNLSGGNQQKVLIGRWLLTNPEILILDEPTRGIDVGAKYEVYQLMYELAAEGKAVIMISSEMPELIGISDRIMVMSNGRMSGIVEKPDFNQEKIMTLATAYL